ncbi:MAG: SLATT domain-containing protein [Desulfobacteraceae bacterium]|jgi:hypothetical protein
MTPKPDISTKQLLPWDEYKDKKPNDALASIYAHISEISAAMCAWYWTSIKTKRRTSIWIRALCFLLIAFGSILPILAAINEKADDKLTFTQYAIALIALAGLLVYADRVFGWSSGWLRYITTVMTMENLTRSFELEWANYIILKNAPLDPADVKALFELARKLEQELTNLQADETTKWVAEFNSGTSLLESMIKSQREETEQKMETIRTSLSTKPPTEKTEGKE